MQQYNIRTNMHTYTKFSLFYFSLIKASKKCIEYIYFNFIIFILKHYILKTASQRAVCSFKCSSILAQIQSCKTFAYIVYKISLKSAFALHRLEYRQSFLVLLFQINIMPFYYYRPNLASDSSYSSYMAIISTYCQHYLSQITIMHRQYSYMQLAIADYKTTHMLAYCIIPSIWHNPVLPIRVKMQWSVHF